MDKTNLLLRFATRAAAPRRSRRLVIERLEARQLLDAAGVVAEADEFSAMQNGPAQRLDVLANDPFDDGYAGERVITSVSFGNEGGIVEIAEEGRAIRYIPPPDFEGIETFVYWVGAADGSGAGSATVRVDVNSPLTGDQFERVLVPGEAATLDVLLNDDLGEDYTGQKRITTVSGSDRYGQIAIADDGRSLVYTYDGNAVGIRETISYVVDGQFSKKVILDVAPVAVGDNYDVLEESEPVSLDVLANDRIAEHPQIQGIITHVLPASDGGTVEIAADGKSLIYTPRSDFVGREILRYVVDGRAEGKVRVRVRRVAFDQTAQLDLDSLDNSFSILVKNNNRFNQSNIRDRPIVGGRPDFERITFVGTPSEGGSVRISADGKRVLYSPPRGFVGQENFTYTMDGNYTATLSANVTRYVRDDRYTVYQDILGQHLDVLQNDFRGNSYSGLGEITSVSAATSGAAVTIDTQTGRLLYSPPADFIGSDELTYVVDGQFEATVRLKVVSPARPDSLSFCPYPAPEGLELPVLANDKFEDLYTGPGLITSAIATNDAARVEIAADGRSLLYFPAGVARNTVLYTVDGTYEASASVSVTNATRRDRVTVDQNNGGTTFDVMANDVGVFLGRSCRNFDNLHPVEDRVITAVGPTEQGGKVTISDDGRQVVYTPPEDFRGIDRFEYTVDDIMRGTVMVEVIRRVRDDLYRVDPGSLANDLAVQMNDLFRADYVGQRQITDVTDSAAGAAISVSGDGKSIRYIPPAGFSGEDSFTYTVDGALKATVQVFVQTSRENSLPRFGSRDALAESLLQAGLERYKYLFGQQISQGIVWTNRDFGSSVGVGLQVYADAAGYSQTNVQTAGVDEGDLIETDGKYLYVLRDGELIITRARPAGNMRLVSRIEIPGEPIAEYLKGNRLTVISRERRSVAPPVYRPLAGGPVIVESWAPPILPLVGGRTLVTVYDVRNRQQPRIVSTTTLDGTYYDSRAVGDYVFVMLQDGFPQSPKPPIEYRQEPPREFFDLQGFGPVPIHDVLESPVRIAPGLAVGNGDILAPISRQQGVYFTREQYIEWFRANQNDILDAALPQFQTVGRRGAELLSGNLVEPENLPVPGGANSNQYVSDRLLMVTSINITENAPAPPTTSAISATNLQAIYATVESLYVFTNEPAESEASTTRIRKFDWDGTTGNVAYVSGGVVPGKMLNQFSADQYQGTLRVATTIQYGWERSSENALFVLRDNLGVIEPVGSLQNLGVDQSIQSVRYLGSRAFVTTFSKTDPLYAIDLSNPSGPRAEGYVALPGYSSYMQLIDANHILAVGRNSVGGPSGPMQVSLFDVSDMATPVRVAQYTMERFSSSLAEADHHAFGYFATLGILAMPISRGRYVRADTDGDGYLETRQWAEDNSLLVFRVDVGEENGDATVELRGTIEHEGPVRRSAYIGSTLYSIGDDAIRSVDVTEPNDLLDTVSLLKSDLGSEATPALIGPRVVAVFGETAPRNAERLTSNIVKNLTKISTWHLVAGDGRVGFDRFVKLRRRPPRAASNHAARDESASLEKPMAANRDIRSTSRLRARRATITPRIVDEVLASLGLPPIANGPG